MADETHMDVSRFSRSGETESKVKMDSGFRRNDGGEGIPAFAGMTEVRGFRLPPE